MGLIAQPGADHLATNEKVAGSNPVEPSMFFRARAANRIGHQTPKLAICEFGSHRAFHTGLI